MADKFAEERSLEITLFPKDLIFSDKKIIDTIHRFKRDKAHIADGYDNKFFRICNKCQKDQSLITSCTLCHKKISFLRKITDSNYWDDDAKSQIHFKSR